MGSAADLVERVSVGLGERSYFIFIDDGVLDRSGPQLAALARNDRLLVVSDELVWDLLGERLEDSLGDTRAVPIIIPAGERSKGWAGLRTVVESLLDHGVERADHVIAFGGGVVGDLAGFASAIVNRGCNFVQIPTTLLAQVDSSVGGKTGINVAAGKNLVGAFHQPSLVLIDPSLLDTLEERQLRAGYAEIVKCALLGDRDLFGWLEREGSKVLSSNGEERSTAIAAAVRRKAAIIEQDERETSGRRALLNLGHTFGHALEAETGFSDRLLHGEAVALGCVLAFDFSVRRGICSAADAERVRRHFAMAGLPTTLGQLGLGGKGKELARRMEHDKKRVGSRTAFILVRGIGDAFVDQHVDLKDVASFLSDAE